MHVAERVVVGGLTVLGRGLYSLGLDGSISIRILFAFWERERERYLLDHAKRRARRSRRCGNPLTLLCLSVCLSSCLLLCWYFVRG